MHKPGSLICWNCSKRTNPGKCKYCQVEVSVPFQIQKREVVEKKHIIEIRKKGKKILKLDLDNLSDIVAKHFTVKKSLLIASPEYLVTNPGKTLDKNFSELIDESSILLNGLTPRVQKVKGLTDDLIIKFSYIEPINKLELRKMLIFMLITYVSMFLAGLYNFSKYTSSQDKTLKQPVILNTSISIESIISALLFSTILLSILLVKDSFQIITALRKNNNILSSYFLPAPPIFELGTLGSFLHQRKIHQDRKSLFYTALYGPIISWTISAIIIILSLKLAIHDPDAAQNYASHSIVANGTFEPMGLHYLAVIANKLNLWDSDVNFPITKNYLLHPITLAGLAGFYISGISLLPASHLNGGYLIRAQYGNRLHKILTYVVIILFLTVHWIMAILLLFLTDRFGAPEVLNEESKMPKNARFWVIFTLLIALLSFPLRI